MLVAVVARAVRLAKTTNATAKTTIAIDRDKDTQRKNDIAKYLAGGASQMAGAARTNCPDHGVDRPPEKGLSSGIGPQQAAGRTLLK
jgi:hypothetical protein